MDEGGHTTGAPGTVVAVGGCVGSSVRDRLRKMDEVGAPQEQKGGRQARFCAWALSG